MTIPLSHIYAHMDTSPTTLEQQKVELAHVVHTIDALLCPLQNQLAHKSKPLQALQDRLRAYRASLPHADLDLTQLDRVRACVRTLKKLAYVYEYDTRDIPLDSLWVLPVRSGLCGELRRPFELLLKGRVAAPQGDALGNFLYALIRRADPEALSWVVAHFPIPDRKKEIFATYNLQLIACITSSKYEILNALFPSSSAQLACQKLLMHSPPQEIDALLQYIREQNHPILETLLERRAHFQERVGPYLVRHQAEWLQMEILRLYDPRSDFSLADYVRSQYAFAIQSAEHVQALYASQEYCTWSYERLLENLVQWRAGVATQRRERQAKTFTTLLRHKCPPDSLRSWTYITTVGFFRRYDRYVHETKKVYKQAQQGRYTQEIAIAHRTSGKPFSHAYQLLHNGHALTKVKTVFLSRLTLGWRHTRFDGSDNSNAALLGELEELHRKVLDARVATPQEREAFYQLVSKTFWLASQLMLPERGNAHCQLMWLALIHKHHHLSPLIPSLAYPQADCFALTWPLSLFQERFLHLWDRGSAQEVRTAAGGREDQIAQQTPCDHVQGEPA